MTTPSPPQPSMPSTDKENSWKNGILVARSVAMETTTSISTSLRHKSLKHYIHTGSRTNKTPPPSCPFLSPTLSFIAIGSTITITIITINVSQQQPHKCQNSHMEDEARDAGKQTIQGRGSRESNPPNNGSTADATALHAIRNESTRPTVPLARMQQRKRRRSWSERAQLDTGLRGRQKHDRGLTGAFVHR